MLPFKQKKLPCHRRYAVVPQASTIIASDRGSSRTETVRYEAFLAGVPATPSAEAHGGA